MNQSINANAIHHGDIRVQSGNVKVGESAEVKGNIFIEEGDLFIASKVSIIGDIHLKNGKVEMDGIARVQGNIFIEEGDLFMEEPVCEGGGAISIKKGNIFIKGTVLPSNPQIKGKKIDSSSFKEKPRLGVLRRDS